MKLDNKAIQQFLGGLNDCERRYLETTLDVSNNILNVIKNNEWITKEVICSTFDIPDQEYEEFINGNWEYDVKTFARLNSLYAECERRKIKKIVDLAPNIKE